MVVDFCDKCNSSDVLSLEHRGTHIALVCSNCNSWIKWVSKKELPLYEKMIANRSGRQSNKTRFEISLKKAIQEYSISKEELISIIDKIYQSL